MRKSICATPLVREREKRNAVKMGARSLSCRQIGVDENAPNVTATDTSEQNGASETSRLAQQKRMEKKK